MDANPYAILGVDAEAPLDQVIAAWRQLVKEWHPDLRGDANALGRMAQINAAYETILAERRGTSEAQAAPRADTTSTTQPARASGWWLPLELRRRLGPELVSALREHEEVRRVERCHAEGSDALLALTDRRLVWLLDDHVLGRVRTLPLTAIGRVTCTRPRPWRRRVAVRIRGGGAVVAFAGLDPATATALAEAIIGATRSTTK